GLCELAVEDQVGHAAGVVAVVVRHEHRVDRAGIDGGALQRDERRRSTVDENAEAVVLEEDAGLRASAGPECVAASDEADRGHSVGRSSYGVLRRIARKTAYESGAGATVDGTGVMPESFAEMMSAH